MEHGLTFSADIKFWLIFGIIFYVAGMLFIGWWAGRRVKGMSDFLVAGRRLPMWMAFATLLATWFGAGSSMGVCGTVYSDGLPGIISDPFAAALSLILAGLFFVGVLRRLRLLTITDVIERRFGKWAGVYASAWMIPVYVGWLGAQILGIGKILNLLTDIDPTWGTVLGAFIVLVYTAIGGMWAVTLTDVVQVTLIILGLFLIVPSAVNQCGGLNVVFGSVQSEHLSLMPTEYSWNSMVAYAGQWCIMGLGCIVGQDLVQRSLASRTDKIASRSAVLAGVAYMALCFVPITIGFSGRILFPDLQDTEALLPLLAGKVLHPVAFTIFLSALVSAIMSSADSSLLACSSLTVNNLVRPFCSMSDSQQLYFTRIITVGITVVATFAALYIDSIYTLMIQSWVSLLVIIFLPVTAALYSKRADTPCIWTTMLGATVVWLGYTVWAGLRCPEGFCDEVFNAGAMYGFVAGIIIFFIYIYTVKTNPVLLSIPTAEEEAILERFEEEVQEVQREMEHKH
ncbi:MAG: sodium:solute symporter family protein [Victivallales bacterium]|nr:sodium:solute symporter family protein [Victivallales bacterium]